MIVYQRIENSEIEDKEYLVDFVYHKEAERVEQYNSIRSNIKIYARNGYIEVYASPRPKVDLEIRLQNDDKIIDNIWLKLEG